eukprot:14860034-Alexandrium_andersonii.AAC.1
MPYNVASDTAPDSGALSGTCWRFRETFRRSQAVPAGGFGQSPKLHEHVRRRPAMPESRAPRPQSSPGTSGQEQRSAF